MTIDKRLSEVSNSSKSDMSSPGQYNSRFTILKYYLIHIFSIKQNKRRVILYFQKKNIKLFN